MGTEVDFTPGPWKADTLADSYEQRRVRAANHEQVAWVCNGSAKPGRTTANALLIAAAPALYEALSALTNDITSYNRDALGEAADATNECVIVAHRALAAAEGR